jgi:hypothetical protein
MLPLPPIAAATLQTARTEPGLLRAQLLTLPPALAASTVPFAVPGVVREVGAGGQLRIGTAWGDLQLRLAGEIAVGRDITVVIRPGTRPEAMLLPIRAQPGAGLPSIALPEAPTGIPAVAAALVDAASAGKPATSLVPVPPSPTTAGGSLPTGLAQAAVLAALATTEGVRVPNSSIAYPGAPVLPAASELLMGSEGRAARPRFERAVIGCRSVAPLAGRRSGWRRRDDHAAQRPEARHCPQLPG